MADSETSVITSNMVSHVAGGLLASGVAWSCTCRWLPKFHPPCLYYLHSTLSNLAAYFSFVPFLGELNDILEQSRRLYKCSTLILHLK